MFAQDLINGLLKINYLFSCKLIVNNLRMTDESSANTTSFQYVHRINHQKILSEHLEEEARTYAFQSLIWVIFCRTKS